MKAAELGSAMVTKSPNLTPLAAMPRAMRLVRRCRSRQLSVTSSVITAGASRFWPATRANAAAIDMGFSNVPGSAIASTLSERLVRSRRNLAGRALALSNRRLEERDHGGQGAAVLDHEEMAAVEELQLRTADARRHPFLDRKSVV